MELGSVVYLYSSSRVLIVVEVDEIWFEQVLYLVFLSVSRDNAVQNSILVVVFKYCNTISSDTCLRACDNL